MAEAGFSDTTKTDSKSEEGPAGQQKTRNDDNQEKRPTDQGEGFDKRFSPAGILPHIDAVIDHGSKRTNQGTEPGGIRTVDQA